MRNQENMQIKCGFKLGVCMFKPLSTVERVILGILAVTFIAFIVSASL